jgi:hypothetical protein
MINGVDLYHSMIHVVYLSIIMQAGPATAATELQQLLELYHMYDTCCLP